MNEDIMQEMKDMIKMKTECMIESYGEVLKKTDTMFNTILVDGHEVSSPEIAKRADMFWNIALQKIESERKDAIRVEEQMEKINREEIRRSRQMPGTQVTPDMNEVISEEEFHKMMNQQNQGESPCAKKSRESAEKIVQLEAEVKKSKGK